MNIDQHVWSSPTVVASVDHEVRKKKPFSWCRNWLMTPSWSLLSEAFQLGNWGRPFLLSYAAKKWIGMRGLHTSATFVRPKELGDKQRSCWEDAPTQSPSTISTSCLGWKLRVTHSHWMSLAISRMQAQEHEPVFTLRFGYWYCTKINQMPNWSQVSWVFAFQYPHHPIAKFRAHWIEIQARRSTWMHLVGGDQTYNEDFSPNFSYVTSLFHKITSGCGEEHPQTPWPRQVHACCPREASRPIIGCFNPKKRYSKGPSAASSRTKKQPAPGTIVWL